MARPKNRLATKKLNISTTPQIQKQLLKLVSTGYFGKNETEAAERLIANVLRNLEKDADLTAERIDVGLRDYEMDFSEDETGS